MNKRIAKKKGLAKIRQEELWNLDFTLAKYILPRLQKFRSMERLGYPAKLNGEEEWNEILDKIIYAFKYVIEKDTLLFDHEVEKKMREKYEEGMACVAKDKNKTDAVMIVPTDPVTDNMYLIRQFRPAVNDYVIEFPAGLVDPGETEEQTVARELYEETGLIAEMINLTVPSSYTSVGMTDEKVAVYTAIVSGKPNTNNLMDNEDIEILTIKSSDLNDVINGAYGEVSIKTRIILTFLNLTC